MSALRDAMSHAVLGWVKPELDETLRLARSEVEYFGEEPQDTSRMQFCAGYLHQVQGTLRMVELYAPAMVAEELELLAHALQENATPDRDEALATLMRGTVLLPDYLERLQSGHRDIPIVLLPLLNDVRAARGAPGLSESVLFAPDLEQPLPQAVPLPEVLSWQARQARMEEGLKALDDVLAEWPEDAEPADRAALDRALKDLLDTVEHIATRRMLWVATSVADALSAGALKHSPAARQAYVGVSRAVRASHQDGSVGLAAPSQEPTRQLLYLVTQSSDRHPALDELRAAFGLDAEAYSQAELDHARGSVTGRNRALLDTVGVAVKEELLRIKDALDLHLRTGAEVSALQTQVTELGNVADTLGMVGLGMARDVIQQQRDSLREMVAGTRETDEATLLDIAGALLYVDASLDDQVSRLGQSGAANAPQHASSESQRTLEILAQEAINNFSLAREGFVAFIETSWSHSELTRVPQLLGEVAGALRMLEIPQPAQYLLGVSRYVSVELIEKRRIPGGQQLDTLADAMASLEYYLEALRENRPNRDEILDITRSSLEKLRYWPLPALVEDGIAPDASASLTLPQLGALEEESAAPAALDLQAFDLPPAGSDTGEAGASELEILAFDTGAYADADSAETAEAGSSEAREPLPVQDAADDSVRSLTDESPLEEAAEDAGRPSLSTEYADEDGAGDAEAAQVVSVEMEKLRYTSGPDATFEIEPAIERGQSTESPQFDHGDAGSFQLADNDIDDDIREVFLEEFDEEIVNLEQMLPQWTAAPGNMERLRSIRRVFHTLKGSGRLVGAKLLGEFSWKTENMLNRVLDGSRPPSPAVIALLQRVADVLPQLNAALKGKGSVTADIQGLQDLADRIGAGEEEFYAASAAAAQETAGSAAAARDAESETPAVYQYDEDGTPAKVDGVLREILEAEVAAHLETVDHWLQQSRPEPIASSEALLRAFHTMNGAFAMADVPEITEVTGAAEQYIKRLWAAPRVPSEEGVAAIADAAHAVRRTIAALAAPSPRIPVFAALASQLTSLRDTLPESRLVPVLVDDSAQNTYAATGTHPMTMGPMDVELTVHDLSRFIDIGSPAPQDHEESAPQDGITLATGSEDADSGAAEPVTFFDLDLNYTTEAASTLSEESSGAAEHETAAAPVEQDRFQGRDGEALPDSAGEEGAREASAAEPAGEREQSEEGVAVDHDAPVPAAPDQDQPSVESFADATPEGSAEPADATRAGDDDAGWEAVGEPAETTDGMEVVADTEHAEAESEVLQEDADAGEVDEPVPAEAVHSHLQEDAEPAFEAGAEESEAHEAEAAATEVQESDAGETGERETEAQETEAGETEAGETEAGETEAGQTEARETEVEVDVEGLAGFEDRAEEVAADAAAEADTDSALADAEVPAPAAGFDEPVEDPVVEARDAASDRSEQLDDAVNDAAPASAEQEIETPMTTSQDVLDDLLDFTELDRDLVDIFVEEGNDLLDHSDGLLAKLRDAPDDRSLVTGLQRDLHTIKGGARMAGINAIGDLGHAIESLLEQVAAQRVELGRDSVQLLERGFDGLHGMVTLVAAHRRVQMPTELIEEFERRAHPERAKAATASVDASAARAPVAPLAPLSAPVDAGVLAEDEIQPYLAQEQVRVRADLLDRLVNNAGEVAIYRSRLEQQLGAFRGAMAELDRTNTRLHDQLRRLDLETEAQIVARYQREQDKRDPTFDPLELDRFSTLQQLSRGLAESAADLTGLQGVLDDLARQYDGLLQQQSRVSSELQDGLMRARMVPFDGIVPRLRRVLRQAASDTGKQVKLQLDGAHGELDRNVLERMTAPLEHLLRNAVAHGLESPKARRKADKAEEGTVQIALRREGAEMVLEVSDDGAGIDHAAIRRRAQERGMVQPGASVSNTDLERMILESGFSTSDSISQLAGRGVGMDVVYSEVRQLGGSLEIQSQSGRGTSFTLRLPQTLAVTQAVFVQIGDTQFAVPVAAVAGVGRIARERFETEGAAYVYAGEDYVLHDLGTLTGHAPARAEGMPQVPLLLVRAGDLRAAVAVDQVLGNREIVVKPVGPQIASVPGIYGATITGDGRIVVILDVAPLVRRHILQPQLFETEAPAPEERRVPLVMVVDDSLTMRKVTGRVLERHNFEVAVARDGVEALERLEERVPDLMLLDIEMPRMDGYELATAMKADPRFKDVPIVMITSRTGDKHRQRALEIGVQRYMGKPYQELDLMRNVYDLLGIARVRE